ncbi:MAG: GHMP kinase [Ignisphaera sp.]|nr:GHMP kinase [Ignisphaera sp.]
MYPVLVISEFQKVYKELPDVMCSAPGRLDFLNTHQDYKGLPVVAVGINLRTYVVLKRVEKTLARVASGNLMDEGEEFIDEFDISEPNILAKPKWFGNYLRAAIIALHQSGYKVRGFIGWIRSWIPIAAGLGSSGTLLVAFIAALNELFNLKLKNKDIAEFAYKAEHDIMGIPCGRLDQYAATYGNIAVIETIPPYNVETLRLSEGVFAAIDSGIRHSTAEIHPQRQREIEEGLKILMEIAPPHLRKLLGYRYWEPKWDSISLEMLEPYLNQLSEKAKNRIVYTIKAHRSTKLALHIMRGYDVSSSNIAETLELEIGKAQRICKAGKLAILGHIMTYQHTLLSRLYDVSLPQLDSIVETLLDFGALGAKLSGAGLGGTVIALFKDVDTAKKAIERIISKGLGARAWVLNVDEGVTRHSVV